MTASRERLAAYLVKGSDPVLRAEAARALVGELVGGSDAALVVEEHEPGSESADTTAATDAASTPPFLSDRRIVVLRDVGVYTSEGLAPLLAYLADPLPSTSVVLVTGDRGRLSPKLLSAVKAVGHVVETDVPANRRGRSAWLSTHLSGAPVRLTPPAVELLDTHLGEDLGRLANLLEALAAAYGAGSKVGPDDVRPFLGEWGAVPPWELTDAIDRGDTALAVSTLHRLLGPAERHPLEVMSILFRHFARMLRLDGSGAGDEGAAAAALGIKGSTFPARKALDQARRLGHDAVGQAIGLLAAADVDLRGASAWPEHLVMEVLVARLSRLRPARAR
ncbi:MAG: DNA polymerase III subunit delta [Actinomycetota bacterium]|nr:DNA polymerase III subunit delta [Acidimicrobiia bacterium]MDQ3147199.1 DNA polymerase III subunit delta [Actinomycetota bacterium]